MFSEAVTIASWVTELRLLWNMIARSLTVWACCVSEWRLAGRMTMSEYIDCIAAGVDTQAVPFDAHKFIPARGVTKRLQGVNQQRSRKLRFEGL